MAFEPGGLHIMLMNMASMPKAGETVVLCLLAGDEEFCVDADVKRHAPAAPSPEHHGDHHGSHDSGQHDSHRQHEDAGS